MWQYFVVKKDSPVYDEIYKYIVESKELRKDIKKFAKSIGVESESVDYWRFHKEFIFVPTKTDLEKFKNKLRLVNDNVYAFRRNSKMYKQFKELLENGTLVVPYCELSKLLNTRNTDTWGLSNMDISASIRCVKDTYLMRISTTDKSISSKYLEEILPSTYYDLTKEEGEL